MQEPNILKCLQGVLSAVVLCKFFSTKVYFGEISWPGGLHGLRNVLITDNFVWVCLSAIEMQSGFSHQIWYVCVTWSEKTSFITPWQEVQFFDTNAKLYTESAPCFWILVSDLACESWSVPASCFFLALWQSVWAVWVCHATNGSP